MTTPKHLSGSLPDPHDRDWLYACWSDATLRDTLLEAQQRHSINVIGLLFCIRHAERIRRLKPEKIDRLTQSSRRTEAALRRLRRLRRGIATVRDAHPPATPARQRLADTYTALGRIELQREWTHWQALATLVADSRAADPGATHKDEAGCSTTTDIDLALARLAPQMLASQRSAMAARLASRIPRSL